MSGSSERPTKTTNPSTTEHISPADPRVPALTVKRPHPGSRGAEVLLTVTGAGADDVLERAAAIVGGV